MARSIFFTRMLCVVLVLCAFNTGAQASTQTLVSGPTSTAPKAAHIELTSPAEGAVLTNPIRVEFLAKKMMLMPAGVPHPDAGHFHLLIDKQTLPPLKQALLPDEQHLDFAKGERSTSLTLPPGTHTLQLILADHLHIPHITPLISQKVTFTVIALPKPRKPGSKSTE